MLVEKLILWLADEQKKLQQSIFDQPPKSLEDMNMRLATNTAFKDVLEKIDRLQRQGDLDEQNR